jgi:hypothetical protein
VYLDAISAKYKGYAQWSLPLPISPSAESFINAVLFSGVLLPMGLTLYCSTVGMTFVHGIVYVCTVGIVCVCGVPFGNGVVCVHVWTHLYMHSVQSTHTHLTIYLSVCLSLYLSIIELKAHANGVCVRTRIREKERERERARARAREREGGRERESARACEKESPRKRGHVIIGGCTILN